MKPCIPSMVVRVIEITLLNGVDPVKITLDEKEQNVEDVCILIARKLSIGPLCRHLFSLQIEENAVWLYPNCTLQSLATNTLVFRLRFKVPNVRRLKELDIYAFNYYYCQVRYDILNCNVRHINYDKDKSEILGLTVADMYRVLLEREMTLEQIQNAYKRFIPKVILRNHAFFIKKRIITSLAKLSTGRHHDVGYVKEEYLNHFENIAPSYLLEEFSAEVDELGTDVRPINLLVDPYGLAEQGIFRKNAGKGEWQHVCTIEDLCFISIRDDGTVEICRKNGIPIYFRFFSKSIMYSFVGLLDGYYRLSVKWTFNLCKDISTPSLIKLHLLKCHGPVGGHFSYTKLQEKRENRPGVFIIRENEKFNGDLFLDVCMQNSAKPKTFSVQRDASGNFLFSYDDKTYPTISALVAAYKAGLDPGGLELLECIPPSEYDKSQLLICTTDTWAGEMAAVTNPEEVLLTAAPQCVNVQNLQVFPNSRKESRSGKTVHYRAMWKHTKRSRIKVAMKELKPELREKLTSEFLELAGRWASLQSSRIVKLYGVTLTGKISMITEYLELGPLDVYLQNNYQNIKQVDLVEAGASLAMAMWQLEEAGMTHGYIRCRKLLIAAHDSNTLRVKLCDPGMHKYNENDTPWIPPECYGRIAQAKSMTTADVWAFGTTLWEIFSMGKKPLVTDTLFYISGNRLPQPADCPNEMYRLMLECWDPDHYKRKRPQAIMRDIYHILYQVFNSRRVHSYATTYPRTFSIDDNHSMTESGGSMHSDATDETLLGTEVPTEVLIPVDITDDHSSDISLSSDSGQLVIFREMGHYSTQVTPDVANMPLNVRSRYNHFFAETIFQLGKNCNVVLQGRIGEGFYGEVYKGVLERADREPQMVAVKQLKANSLNTTRVDLEREIVIMQQLEHENIVGIIGAIHEPDMSLVMEYVPCGSLRCYLHINKETLKLTTLLKFAEDVAKGMEYLGKKKIVHRDLAARNILVANEHHVKISDFGLAQFVDATNNDYYMLNTSRDLPIKWYAPESLQRGLFSTRSDVWSYGVTLYEMFSLGEEPKLDESIDELDPIALFQSLERGLRLPCPPGDGRQDIYRTLMTPCWRFRSQERPSFTAIIGTIATLRSDQLF